jgi:hypothetical protein
MTEDSIPVGLRFSFPYFNSKQDVLQAAVALKYFSLFTNFFLRMYFPKTRVLKDALLRKTIPVSHDLVKNR